MTVIADCNRQALSRAIERLVFITKDLPSYASLGAGDVMILRAGNEIAVLTVASLLRDSATDTLRIEFSPPT